MLLLTRLQSALHRAGRPLGAVLIAMFLGVGSGAAQQQGPFGDRGTQPPLDHEIIAPGTCAGCHGDFDPGLHVEPWPTWAGSMMANAGRDPLFWAALDVANHDVEGSGAEGIGEFCLRCHVPTAWLGGRANSPAQADGCSLLGNLDDPNNDFMGVSCHFCHRMMVNESPPAGEDPVYYENARFWIDDVPCMAPTSGPCRRGPYDYMGPGGGNPPPHEWEFSQYHVDSDLCGNCHNVSSPVNELIDQSGEPTGLAYPIERTFKEWQQSEFSDPAGSEFQTCQGCHMPDAVTDPVYACVFEEHNRTGDLPIHQFVGGNTWIPAVLREEYPTLGRADSLNATIAWATDMLENRSAVVEVTSPATVPPGGTLDAEVRITNLSGHKLPTGYGEGRRMWIHLTARDGAGALVWESGGWDAATGVLAEDPQIKIYEVQQGIWNRNGTNECDITDESGRHLFHFVLNDCIALDNRIPPLGFSGAADPETQPVDYVYPETTPGSGILVNHDLTSYAIPIPEGTPSPVTLEATLNYQTASKEYVEFLRDEAVNNGFPDDCIPRSTGLPEKSRGELLFDMWVAHDRSPPVAMGVAGIQVEVTFDIFADGFESGDTSAWSLAVP